MPSFENVLETVGIMVSDRNEEDRSSKAERKPENQDEQLAEIEVFTHEVGDSYANNAMVACDTSCG